MTKARMTTTAMMEKITRRRRIDIGYRTYRTSRRFSTVQLLIVAFAFVVVLGFSMQMGRQAQMRVAARVDSVIDGDTLLATFSDGHSETIRLLGVDTPETHHPTKPVGCFGPEAAQFSQQNLDGQNIELEYDVEKKDKYGRTLAYVYLDDARFNDELVRQGYAKILNISPNNKYANQLLVLEINAKKQGVGMWGSCAN